VKDAQDEITGYHAHVYYEPATRELAARLRDALGERFDVILGRWHDLPVGPHPQSMYQVAFRADQFDKVVPFLMLNRAGLDVLVHPETGDDLVDHRDYALWLGQKLPLNFESLRRAAS
jgi:aromatic ring-cleaving dioxygenase